MLQNWLLLNNWEVWFDITSYFGLLKSIYPQNSSSCKTTITAPQLSMCLFSFTGWATQFAAFIFMRRNFEEDKKVISNMLDYYRRVDKHVNVSIIFYVLFSVVWVVQFLYGGGVCAEGDWFVQLTSCQTPKVLLNIFVPYDQWSTQHLY